MEEEGNKVILGHPSLSLLHGPAVLHCSRYIYLQRNTGRNSHHTLQHIRRRRRRRKTWRKRRRRRGGENAEEKKRKEEEE